MLSVDYPLAPEHPFPAGLNAAADAIHWLVHDSGETGHYFVGEWCGGTARLLGVWLAWSCLLRFTGLQQWPLAERMMQATLAAVLGLQQRPGCAVTMSG